MVKLGRGPRRQSGLGRQEPVPLFPPGDLPVFGPPPVNMRRPMPPPRGLPPNFAPPPPPISRAHLPPPPPPPHMRSLPLHPLPPPRYPRRPGPPPPPPLRPLLQTPVLPPRPLAFMRGGRAPIHMGRPGPHMKRLGKSMKKNRSKKNKSKDFNKGDGNSKQNQTPASSEISKEVIEGPWVTEAIKTEIEKMNTLKKEAEEKKEQTHWDSYNEQKKKVESMATAAKMEYIGSQPDGEENSSTKNGTPEQK